MIATHNVSAYEAGNIQPASNRYFFKFATDLKGGTTHDDYTKLVPTFAALTPACL